LVKKTVKRYFSTKLKNVCFNLNGTVPVNRHVLETGEQHKDYKKAGPSICVPSFLSAAVPLSRRFCLLSC